MVGFLTGVVTFVSATVVFLTTGYLVTGGLV
jgi:hypothetical protein